MKKRAESLMKEIPWHSLVLCAAAPTKHKNHRIKTSQFLCFTSNLPRSSSLVQPPAGWQRQRRIRLKSLEKMPPRDRADKAYTKSRMQALAKYIFWNIDSNRKSKRETERTNPIEEENDPAQF